jgi:hypothetical protein
MIQLAVNGDLAMNRFRTWCWHLVLQVYGRVCSRRPIHPRKVLKKLRTMAQEVVSDEKFFKAMEPTGTEPWKVPLEKLSAVMAEDSQKFVVDAKKFDLKFD